MAAAPIQERRTQSERAAESRDKMVRAAIDLLGTRGYAGTTLAEIGKSAGVSRGLVTHHFGNKEQCIHAVVAEIHEAMAMRLTRLDGQPRGLAAIDQLIEKYLRGKDQADRYTRAMFVIIVEAFTTSPGLQPAVAENDATVRTMIASMIDEALADNEIERVDRPEDVGAVVLAMMRGLLMQHLADPNAISRRDLSAVAKRMVRAELAG